MSHTDIVLELSQALSRVKALHAEILDRGVCSECLQIFPCPTLKAIEVKNK